MEPTKRTIVYLICVDDGIIAYGEKEGLFRLPVVVLNKQYNDSNEIKKAFFEKTKVRIGKNNLVFLKSNSDKSIRYYYALINLNQKGANILLCNSVIQQAKAMNFAYSFSAKWDEGSETAIQALKQNPNLKDALSFICSGLNFGCFSDKSKRIASDVFRNYFNIWQSDCPDVVVETNKTITGIECFRIDASGKRADGGSVGVIGEKQMELQLAKAKTGDIKAVSGNFSNSIQNLWKDFIGRFRDHDKPKEYIEHLRRVKRGKGKRHSLGLYVEDGTLLGSYFYYADGKMFPLYIFNIKEFWDLFLSKKRILFVVFQQTGSNSKEMFFITKHDFGVLNKQRLIKPLDKIQAKFSNTPQLIGTSFPVPDEWL